MIKKIFTGIIFFIVIFSLGFQTQTFFPTVEDVGLVQKTFLETGVFYEYANINSWAKITNSFVNFSNLMKYGEIAIKDMEIDKEKTKISHVEEKNFRQIEIVCRENNRQVNIVIQSLKSGLKEETYLLIDEYLLKGYSDVLKEKGLINNIFKELKLKSITTICFVGTFEGKLNKEKSSSIVKLVLNKLGAQKIEGMEDENVMSISAYSTKLKEYIKVGSEKINLNVAIRYSSFDDKTYLWLATPIIAIEY
ncbi:MAG TPA: YwmB family TATA-box binding protein [Clostridia bacterium]|nr:YwmB family TATA-box binding protein [Clostridia bacterium]